MKITYTRAKRYNGPSNSHNPVPTCFEISWSQLVTAGHTLPYQNDGIVSCATTQFLHVLQFAGHIWSQGGHRSNLKQDSESAQNFGTVTCATTKFSHVLRLAGHSWSQGGHRSNPMPDLESAQNFGIATCAASKFRHVFVISWSQLVTGSSDARFGVSMKFYIWDMCHSPPIWLETLITGNWGQFGPIWTNLGPIWDQIQKSALYKALPPKFPTQRNLRNENPTNGARDLAREGRTDARTHARTDGRTKKS